MLAANSLRIFMRTKLSNFDADFKVLYLGAHLVCGFMSGIDQLSAVTSVVQNRIFHKTVLEIDCSALAFLTLKWMTSFANTSS